MSVKNNCSFIGYTGDDVKVHNFEGGGSLGRVPLAINKSYKNSKGEKINQTVWVNLVVRNKLCEIFEKYIRKGSFIAVQSEFNSRSYQNEQGQTVYSNEFHVSDVNMLDSKSQSAGSGTNTQPQPNQNPPQDEDDLLF